jgi:hypothetical protein
MGSKRLPLLPRSVQGNKHDQADEQSAEDGQDDRCEAPPRTSSGPLTTRQETLA